MKEYLRPWKLATFAIGMGWLIWGAFYYKYSDWDVGISLLMGFLAYISAPWSVRVIWTRQWKRIPLALFCWWVPATRLQMERLTQRLEKQVSDIAGTLKNIHWTVLALLALVVWLKF